MPDKLNLDVHQPTVSQSQAQTDEKPAWSTPSLTVIDINSETEKGGQTKTDATLLS